MVKLEAGSRDHEWSAFLVLIAVTASQGEVATIDRVVKIKLGGMDTILLDFEAYAIRA